MTIEAAVHGEIVLPPGIPDRLQARIEKALSFGNPAYFRAIANDRRTDGIPEKIEAYRYPHNMKGIACPRGTVGTVKQIAIDEGISVAFADERMWGRAIDAGDPKYQERDYQEQAIRALLRVTQGYIVIPCGGGKSTIGASVIHRVAKTSVVLVHTEDLHDQWLETLDEKLGIKAGSVIGSKFKPRLDGVTVASIQKLVRMLTGARQYDALQLLANAGVCILDEAHHAPASTYQVVLRNCPARVRLGLTATPSRDDGLTRLVKWSFGDNVFQISVEELIRRGYLMRPQLSIYETDFEFSSTTKDTDKRRRELDKAIERDEARLLDVAKLAARKDWRRKVTLVLANRKDYAMRLSREIWKQGVEASAITSDTNKSVRKVMMRKFRRGEVKMMIATSLADEGLDCPSLSRIILAWPEAPRSRTVQRIGRLMRPYDETPVFVDVLDSKVPELVRAHDERCKIYRRFKMAGGDDGPRLFK